MNDFEARLRNGLRDLAEESPDGVGHWNLTEERMKVHGNRRTAAMIGGGALAAVGLVFAATLLFGDNGDKESVVVTPSDETTTVPTTGTTVPTTETVASTTPVTAATLEPDLAAFRNGSWEALPDAPIVSRSEMSAVWSGREVLLFGGFDAAYKEFRNGAAYDPATKQWRKIPTAPIGPSARAKAAWAGGEMWVLAGKDEGASAPDLVAYDPKTDAWRKAAVSDELAPGYPDQLVAMGGRLLVGSGLNDGPGDQVVYDLATGVVEPFTRPAGTETLGVYRMVWNGYELFARWGVSEVGDAEVVRFDSYDPETRQWRERSVPTFDAQYQQSEIARNQWFPQFAVGIEIVGEHYEEFVAYDPNTDTYRSVPALEGAGGCCDSVPPEASVAGPVVIQLDVSADGSNALQQRVLGVDVATGNSGVLPAPQLGVRQNHAQVWAGTGLFVWGGAQVTDDAVEETLVNDGAFFTPGR